MDINTETFPVKFNFNKGKSVSRTFMELNDKAIVNAFSVVLFAMIFSTAFYLIYELVYSIWLLLKVLAAITTVK